MVIKFSCEPLQTLLSKVKREAVVSDHPPSSSYERSESLQLATPPVLRKGLPKHYGAAIESGLAALNSPCIASKYTPTTHLVSLTQFSLEYYVIYLNLLRIS